MTPSPRDAGAERAIAARGDGAQSQAFLATHRGQAAFAREYARLISAIVANAQMVGKMDPERPAVVRQSPERVILQLGPVALTVAWLRKGGNSAAIGELLFIFWRGTIASRGGEPTAYTAKRSAAVPPAIVFEETLVAYAIDEATWTWRTASLEVEGVSSAILAERCVRRLVELQDQDAAVPQASISLVTTTA